MYSENWNERQRQWQLQRKNFFQRGVIHPSDDKVNDDIVDSTDYSLCRITIKDNNICFSSFPDSKTSINLVRNTNYIFDVSDPSNTGHAFVISRVPASGKVRDLTYQGIPGNPGSFVSIFIGKGRPNTLYYYDQKYKGLGGRLDIMDNGKS